LKDLLVELHAEQKGERVAFEQLVGGVGRREVKCRAPIMTYAARPDP
jgi:hypothetical protein